MQGSFPTLAPVKPYTELALIFSASCRPSSTLRRNESVSSFKSALTLHEVDIVWVQQDTGLTGTYICVLEGAKLITVETVGGWGG